jgi:NADPH:quinone reductase-like Zn-dependent oxidoreductase
MRAVMVDAAGRLALAEVGEPEPDAGQLLVGVRAISINRGEILRARAAGPGSGRGGISPASWRGPARADPRSARG